MQEKGLGCGRPRSPLLEWQSARVVDLRIHRVFTIGPAIEHIEHVLHRAAGHAIPGFPGDAGQVRREDHVGQTHQRIALLGRFTFQDVQTRAAQMAAGQG